jgi:hypothetical protein
MAADHYVRPTLPPGVAVHSFVPEHGATEELTPEKYVFVLNRGVDPVRDKFDGTDYVIPPGVNEMPYGAAMHFRGRAVVPGSRNTETGKQESFLAILGIDKPEKCTPFSPEQCEAFGLRIEAIAREELMDPAARDARPVSRGDIERTVLSGQGRGVTMPPQAVMEPRVGGDTGASALLGQPDYTAAQEDTAAFRADGGTVESEEPTGAPRLPRRR